MTGKRIGIVRKVGLIGLTLALSGGIPGVAVAGASAQISAQVNPTEPTHAVVTDKRAMVRCGPGAAYYPVAELRPNAILMVDGDTPSGWARVRFPANASALVRADYVDLSPDGKFVTLNRDDALVAYNALAGARGSWSKLLPKPLKAGTKLEVIAEASNDLTNELIGYQVKAPKEAHGFVRMSFIRPATTSEVEAWLAANETRTADDSGPDDAEVSMDDQAPAVDPGPPADAPASDTEPESVQPAAESELAQAEPDTEPLVQPMIADEVPVVETPEPADDATPTPTPEEAQPAEASDETTQPESKPEPEKPAPLRISSIEELEQLFTAVQKQTPEEAEFGPLLAEVQRMYEATPDTPENAGLRRALRKRLSVLKIRQRLQEAARSNAQAVESASIREQEIANRIREIEIERSYAVVGRLLPSAVYDGTRLPRMYRVQSLGTTEAPRTLGYLKPDPKLDLEFLLGKTIGVVGKPQLDPRLNLLIIKPIKVDVIDAAGGAGQQ